MRTKSVDLGNLMQRTLKNPISCSGVGLHSGAHIKLSLHPADINTGIVFECLHVASGHGFIQAKHDSVIDRQLCTKIGNSHGASIATVEHLMAALRGMQIDNVLVRVDGPEIPAMDGSSSPFVFLIECAGIVEQAAARKVIKIHDSIRYKDEERSAVLSPADGFFIDFEIDFPTKQIAHQHFGIQITEDTFKYEISRARTFGFLQDVEYLRSIGLAQGGSLENAIVISNGKVMNDGGLRYKDEFVRHKILDSVGDLYMAGHQIEGHFWAYKAGHEVNSALLQELFANPEAWSLEDAVSSEEKSAKTSVPVQKLVGVA
jgi:UDP-3-O-[3-hydroxymyristoyl] N-acetylglucosamine deacetylase